jgi:hypothetical protein
VSEENMLGIPKTRKQVMKALALTTPSQLSFHFVVHPLPPNEICLIAPLTSRRCTLNIYSKNIRTEYFKHAA